MKVINIKNKKEAIKVLSNYQTKEQSGAEIKLINVHLCNINRLIGDVIFTKNDLYVTGETLYDVMHPVGGKGHHHYHGISIDEFLNALNTAARPVGIYTTYLSRFVIATLAVNSTNENIVLVIEKGAGLKNNRFANINKLISVYPKHNLNVAIAKHKGVRL